MLIFIHVLVFSIIFTWHGMHYIYIVLIKPVPSCEIYRRLVPLCAATKQTKSNFLYEHYWIKNNICETYTQTPGLTSENSSRVPQTKEISTRPPPTLSTTTTAWQLKQHQWQQVMFHFYQSLMSARTIFLVGKVEKLFIQGPQTKGITTGPPSISLTTAKTATTTSMAAGNVSPKVNVGIETYSWWKKARKLYIQGSASKENCNQTITNTVNCSFSNSYKGRS